MSEHALRHQEERGVHLLTMAGGANALDLPVMAGLRDRLAGLREGGSPPLLLASAHPTLFCPGWDLKGLAAASRAQVAEVLTAFNRLILDLFSYPGPTAAAVNGHAVAGGCLLALACDLRVMASGRPRIGLAELNLGVPVPAGSLRMLQARLGAAVVEEITLLGEGCAAERAVQLGVVQRAVPPEEVVVAADRELRKLASKSARAYAATKALLYGEVWQVMERVDGDAEREFLDCWFDAETRQRVADVARSLGKQ